MQIVSYEKDTFIECSPFSWGMTLFSFGCNLHCKMCEGYNYERVIDKENIIGNAIDIIKDNITPMHDCVVFLGGEPTIWGDKLIEALKYCKSIGLKTKIFSNGLLPNVIKQINDLKLCDAWSIDYKGVYNVKKELSFNGGYKKYMKTLYLSIINIMENELPLEIRTTIYEANKDSEDIIKAIICLMLVFYDKGKHIIQYDVRDKIKFDK